MKKFIFMTLISLMSFVSANAQTVLQSTKLLDNTYVGVMGGVHTNMKLNKVFPLNSSVGVRVGKEISPVFGIQFAGVAALGDNYVNDSHTFIKAVNAEMNGTINWSNLIFGYTGVPRRFEISSVTGIGWLSFLNGSHRSSSTNMGDGDELTAKTALEFAFNLGDARAWRIFVQPGVYWNMTHGPGDAVQFGSSAAQMGVQVGVDYKFKTSNGTHNFKMYNIGDYNTEINALRNDLSKKPKEVTKVVEKVIEKQNVIKQNVYVIAFDNDNAELNNDAKTVLNSIAANTDVTVEGYADGVGSDTYNQNLSERRATTVTNYLTQRNVNVRSSKGFGKTGKYSARVVIVEPVQ